MCHFQKERERNCPAVVKSLREDRVELLTFFDYPKRMWMMLRTTNCLERINEEFRRRVKTQGGLPNTDEAWKMLYGLLMEE